MTSSMTDLLTSAQMRGIEQNAIDSGAVTGIELMERAGAGAVAAILAQWPDLARGAHRAVVLCGPGNNGGDGFVIARLLKDRGWDVEVFHYGHADRLPPDARTNLERWRVLGPVVPLSFPAVTPADVARFHAAAGPASGTALVVDALFGIGLARPLDGLAPLAQQADDDARGARTPPLRRVAVDLPSGLYSDVPAAADRAVRFPADLTVTFHRRKPAHVHPATAADCGKVVVVDIGLEPGSHPRHDA